MSTNSEKQNIVQEEYLNDLDPVQRQNNSQFRTVLTSGIITRSDGLKNYIYYNPNNLNALQNNVLDHPTVPRNTSFDKNPSTGDGTTVIFSGVSNGYLVLRSGITDFTAYNDYIHYDDTARKFNIMSNIVWGSFHFQMYGNKYRKS